MDITPSQPEQPPGTRKTASTVAGNSKKKPRNKQPEAQQSEPAANTLPPEDTTSPVAASEEHLLEDMDGMIATAAYYLAERRNFAPGHELEDWLEAEQQVRRKA